MKVLSEQTFAIKILLLLPFWKKEKSNFQKAQKKETEKTGLKVRIDSKLNLFCQSRELIFLRKPLKSPEKQKSHDPWDWRKFFHPTILSISSMISANNPFYLQCFTINVYQQETKLGNGSGDPFICNFKWALPAKSPPLSHLLPRTALAVGHDFMISPIGKLF